MSNEAENLPANRKRIKARLKSVLGVELARDDVVDFVVAERSALRHTISEEILGTLLQKYGALDQDQLETLVWVVEWFVQDPQTGNIDLLKPPPNHTAGFGLRSV